MHLSKTARAGAAGFLACLLVTAIAGLGCAGGSGNIFSYNGLLFPVSNLGGTPTTGGSTGTTQGGSGQTSTGTVDPCDETQARKFVRISMRNLSEDHVQYFLVLIAFVNGDRYPDGAVCASDVALYTSFGYTLIAEGAERNFGNYCIEGPALLYFHRQGQFRGAGTSGLASAIGPAQGTSATFDSFFNANGQSVPVPDVILFHNPGTTAEGRALKVSQTDPSPCTGGVVVNPTPECQQDGFYYVDEQGLRSGSTVLGTGSYVRTPAEIQGTGCSCGIGSVAFAELAPPGSISTSVECNEFVRGGRVDYAFIREDTEPPIPQAVWRVSDSSGTRIHDFDPASGVR